MATIATTAPRRAGVQARVVAVLGMARLLSYRALVVHASPEAAPA